MSDEATRYARVHALVADALALPEGADLNAWLAGACGDDAPLRAEVEELLALSPDDDSGPLAEEALRQDRRAREQVVDDVLDRGTATWVPETIGEYRVRRQLGQGGMGVVYEAEQASPRRRVAIKLLHPLHSTPDRLRRFRQEAAVLARLEHPGIAQVFEVGSFDAGRGEQPFLVMELIHGSDLRTHCVQQGLDRRQRIAMLAAVADATHHAHEHGVIHRDLKPDNVLVDSHGHPRILDFGIARVESASATLSTIVTEEGQLVGTLAYMAPEQLEPAQGVATRQVDVYALGVLGFELLVGRLPHDIEDLSLSKAITLLTTRDVPRAGRLDPSLRGDLETILGKALEPETARRYDTAAAFSADLRRHLEHLPVHARPPSRAYRARKFTRRHRGLVAGAIATVLALVAGTVISLLFADDAAEQRDVARQSERQAVNGLLQSAQVLLDAGLERRAENQLALVPEARRGLTWRLLKRAAPHRPDATYGWWSFRGDTHVVNVVDLPDGSAELMEVSLTEYGPTRRLFGGIGLRQVLSTTPSGFVVGVIRGDDSDNQVALLDMDRERVLLQGWLHGFRTEFTVPEGLPGAGERESVTYERDPEVSDDGRTALWYPAPDLAEVRVDGEVVHVLEDLHPLESAHLGPDGLVFAENRLDEVTVRDVADGALRLRYAPPPGAAATAYPVEGAVLLASAWENAPSNSGWHTPVKWKRHPLGPAGQPSQPLNPFAGVEPAFPGSSWPKASWPRDGRFVAVAGPAMAEQRLVDTESGAPLTFRRLDPDINSGGELRIEDLDGNMLRVSPDGSRVVYFELYGRMEIVELDPRETEPAYDPRGPVLRGHAGPDGKTMDGWIYQFALSGDGSLIASAAPLDPLLRVWDTRTGEQLAVLRRASHQKGSFDALIAFDASSDRLLVSTPWPERGLAVVAWDLVTGEVKLPVTDHPVDAPHLTLLDGFLAALGPRDPVRLNQKLSVHSGRLLANDLSDDPGEGPIPRWTAPRTHPEFHAGLGVAPTGSPVALAQQISPGVRQKGALVIVDPHTDQVLEKRELPYKPWCAAYSPDGRTLAVGTDEGHVLLYDTETYTQELDWVAHDGEFYDYVYSLVWTPDGTRLVTASGDATLRVWDTRTPVAARVEDEAWRALRASMAAREDLAEIYETLEGEERAAARAELLRRRGE